MHPTSPREKASVTAALVAVQVFFGVHYLAAKFVLEDIPPRAWAAMRVAGAAVILLAAAKAMGRRFPRSRGDLARLALFSVFGVVVNQVCFIEGLARTTATHSSIINTLVPAGTLLFAVLFGREVLTGAKAASLGLALAGVLLVIRPEHASFSSRSFVGDLLTLVNALSYSFFLVISKRILARNDALAATAVLMSFGAVGVLAVGWAPLTAFHPASVHAVTWAWGLFIVLFPTAGAYFLIYWALARAESSLVALFVYLQPVVAAALSVSIRGEALTARTIAGAALIFAGVWLAVRPVDRSRPRQRDPRQQFRADGQ